LDLKQIVAKTAVRAFFYVAHTLIFGEFPFEGSIMKLIAEE